MAQTSEHKWGVEIEGFNIVITFLSIYPSHAFFNQRYPSTSAQENLVWLRIIEASEAWNPFMENIRAWLKSHQKVENWRLQGAFDSTDECQKAPSNNFMWLHFFCHACSRLLISGFLSFSLPPLHDEFIPHHAPLHLFTHSFHSRSLSSALVNIYFDLCRTMRMHKQSRAGKDFISRAVLCTTRNVERSLNPI